MKPPTPTPDVRGLTTESRAETTVPTALIQQAGPEEIEDSQPSSSFSSNANLSRMPQEGKDGSWKDHPSHKLYQTQSVNHNDINLPET